MAADRPRRRILPLLVLCNACRCTLAANATGRGVDELATLFVPPLPSLASMFSVALQRTGATALELGCGEGNALLQLQLRYRNTRGTCINSIAYGKSCVRSNSGRRCQRHCALHCVCTLHIRCARTRCHRCSSKPCSRPSAHRSSSARHKPSPWPTPPRTSNSSARRCAATRHVRRVQLCSVAVPPLYRRCLRYATSRCTLPHPAPAPAPALAAPPRPARAPSATPRACTHAAQREGTPVVHIADTRLNFRKAAGSVAVVARVVELSDGLCAPYLLGLVFE